MHGIVWAKVKSNLNTVVTFWATFGKFGLLLNLASGHSGPEIHRLCQFWIGIFLPILDTNSRQTFVRFGLFATSI